MVFIALESVISFSYHSPDGVFSTGSVWELCVNNKLALLFLKYLSFLCLTTISTITFSPSESVCMCVRVCGLQNGINIVVLGLEGEVSPWERQRILNKAVCVRKRQRESLHMWCMHECLRGSRWVSPCVLWELNMLHILVPLNVHNKEISQLIGCKKMMFKILNVEI